MKQFKLLSIVIALILVFAAFGPASAQLGTTDSSQIKIQNVSGGSVQVTVQFVASVAPNTTYTPNPLSNSPVIANPFTLANNASILIDVSTVPNLPSGSYSVVISSTGKVVATASVFGQGTSKFSGAYPSFSGGATTIYLATATFNYFGWFSMISVMNVGSAPTDVQVTIVCANAVGTTGTLTKTGLLPNTSVTWALKNTIPAGFNAGTVCQGGAIITSTNSPQPLVAVNNQNKPALGATNSFESVTTGSPVVYVPQLQSNFFGWVSALNILKQGSGNTTVTITYGDGAPSSSCNLTDAAPACQLLMSNSHPLGTRFAATLTTSPSKNLLVSVGSTHTSGLSGGYVGFGSGAPSVAIPLAMKNSFNWSTVLNCMNVSATPTTFNIAYEGYPAYNYPTTFNQGGSVQINLQNDTNLPPTSWNGSVIVTANAAGAQVACMIGSSYFGTPPLPGDWTLQYNALP